MPARSEAEDGERRPVHVRMIRRSTAPAYHQRLVAKPEAPVIVLGVRRSGTTLLRVILDRSPSIAIPDESYFVPQLATRHRGPIDAEAFADDVSRIGTLSEWGVDVREVRARLRDGMTTGDAIAAVFETYAADRGKPSWGDKTPMYMQYLPQLERLFPQALYVHLIRDGRDAATSFLSMPGGIVTETWAHPSTPADFACQWRTEVEAARALGSRVGPGRYQEVRYEALVADPKQWVEAICEFAGLRYDEGMLAYASDPSLGRKPHQQRLQQPPTPGVRDWRRELSPSDAMAFEDVAGLLLAELGYSLSTGEPHSPSVRALARLASYRVRSAAWRQAGGLLQRSPLWRRRHPVRA